MAAVPVALAAAAAAGPDPLPAPAPARDGDGRGASPTGSYLDGPPPGHTGGFGEPTCHRCHFGRPVDPPGGSLAVEDLPEEYRPGEEYAFEVRVTGAGLGRAGFQLSARCAAGEGEGEQAGELAATSGRTEVTVGTGEAFRGTAGVQYASHTESGTQPTRGDTAAWTLRWRAPPGRGDDPTGAGGSCPEVVVHVAANAADGDASEFGDRIFVEAFRLPRTGR